MFVFRTFANVVLVIFLFVHKISLLKNNLIILKLNNLQKFYFFVSGEKLLHDRKLKKCYPQLIMFL